MRSPLTSARPRPTALLALGQTATALTRSLARRFGTRMPARLSAMDAGFLQVESSSAPMHLGWAAVFAAPEHGPRPSFEQLREHVHGRLDRAPRYRQRLVDTPLGGGDPVWLDDETFDIARHVRRAAPATSGCSSTT